MKKYKKYPKETLNKPWNTKHTGDIGHENTMHDKAEKLTKG